MASNSRGRGIGKVKKVFFAIGMAVCLAACGSQQNGDVVKTAQGQSCKVDATAVCLSIAKKPIVMMQNGLTMDSTNAGKDTQRTATLITSYQVPEGSTLGFHCQINMQHQSVIYAGLDRGAPTLTDHDVDYLRSVGMCAQ